MPRWTCFLLPLLLLFTTNLGAADDSLTSLEKIEQAYRRGELDLPTAIAYKLYAIKDYERLPGRFRSPVPTRCATSELLLIRRNWNLLPKDIQLKLQLYRDRPTLSGTEHIYDTANFKIHWTNEGADSTDTTYVDSLAAYAEYSWAEEVDTLGWDDPPPDGGGGGDDKYDLYVKNLGAGLAGYCEIEAAGPDPSQEDATSFIVMDDSLNTNQLKTTTAHEFNHACQFSYSWREETAWYENTAVWMEDMVYDAIDTYYWFLGSAEENPLTYPEWPITYFADGSTYPYGGCIWPKYMHEKHSDPDVMRRIWDLNATHTNNHTIEDIDSVLTTDYGSSFEEALKECSAWRYFSGSNDDGLHYEEGSNWCDPYVDTVHNHSSYPANGNEGSRTPDYYGASFIQFNNTGFSGGLDIAFDGEDGQSWAAVVVSYDTLTGSSFGEMSLDTNGYGAIFVSWDGYARVVLIPVVLSGSDTNLTYTYNAQFLPSDSFPPQVAVVLPNGGEAWSIGDIETISWVATDTTFVDHLDILYSTDAGATWDTVSTSEANDSAYAWTIPNTPSDSCFVEIVAYDPWDNDTFDISDDLFSIGDFTPPQIVLLVPNGGEDWAISDTNTISWVATDLFGIDSVNIFYSTDGGSSWDTVSTGEANDSSYVWIVPPTPSDSCLVKLIAYDPSLNPGEDTSDGWFRISDQTPPQVAVSVPNGGEDWAIGGTDTISWVATDLFGVDSVSIFCSIDGGSSWDTVATGEANDFYYIWTIPPTPSDSCLVRVIAYDPSLNAGQDDSDGLFRISDLTPPQVTVIVPNGGEDWAVGEVDTVRWVAWDNVGVDYLDIYCSTDAGSSWDTVSAGEVNDSSYTWVIPPTLSDSCLLKIIVYDQSLNPAEDESDSLFRISDQTPPQVTVTVPNGGEDWAIGDIDTITWVATDLFGVDSIDISYSTDGGSSWDTVATGEANDSTHPWLIPDPPSDSCLVRIIAYDPSLNPGEDISDSWFRISDQTLPQVTVTVPNGGENWWVGEEDTIRWVAYDEHGVDSVNIYYSTDGGANWDSVSTGEVNDSSYIWMVPLTPSDSCLVKLIAYDPYLNPGEDESDSLFAISDSIPPQVAVIVPNGGENWAVGEEDTIYWVATDNVGVDHLDIFYSTDAGSSWDTVATGEANDFSYFWIIPPTPSDSCLVKLVAYDQSLNWAEDESDSLFRIYFTGLEELAGELPPPRTFRLSQNYPNPFSHATTIPFQVPGSRGAEGQGRSLSTYEHINLSVYDVAGRLVKRLLDGGQLVTGYELPVAVRWDGTDAAGRPVPNGVYFYRLSATQGKTCQFVSTRKMILLQ